MINRHLKRHLLEALESAAVVYLAGPRQAGKSTLAQDLISENWNAEYISFDDITALAGAKHDPESFLESLKGPVILDEVQLVPELFRPLKRIVDSLRASDQESAHGRFFLTGSAKIMALPELSEALVGRMQLFTLYPLSSGEVMGIDSGLIGKLFEGDTSCRSAGPALTEMVCRASFPELEVNASISPARWYSSYLSTSLQGDMRALADIEKITKLPQLLQLIAARAGGLSNDAALGRDAGLNAMTCHRYKMLLTQLFLVHEIPPWHRNLRKRLVKSGKGYVTDTGLLCHLLGVDADAIEQSQYFGSIVENFVASELMKQLTCMSGLKLFHFRTANGKEVDFVLERSDGKIVGIEVKAGKRVTADDFSGLHELQGLAPDSFVAGIVLYGGDKTVSFGKQLAAVPVSTLWS
jgi:predicted AAA+ superfamily ATPase